MKLFSAKLDTVLQIIKELKDMGEKVISVSDLAYLSHINYTDFKEYILPALEKKFKIEKKGNRIYIVL